MTLESSASSALKRASLLSLTWNNSDKDKNICTKIVTSTGENNGMNIEVSGKNIWPTESYFKNQLTDYHMEKVNYPENSIICEPSIFDNSKV